MYAIVNINGTQTKMAPEEVIEVPRLTGEPGQTLTFDQVLLFANGDKITVGQPYLKGAKATVEVLGSCKEEQRGVGKDPEENLVPREVKGDKAFLEHEEERGVGITKNLQGGVRGRRSGRRPLDQSRLCK